MKEYGITVIPAIPMRKTPSHRAEMVSQLLFGEMYEVKEIEKSWIEIKCLIDNYTGWIDTSTHHPLSSDEMLQLNKTQFFTNEIFTEISIPNKKQSLIVPFGSLVYGVSETKIGKQIFRYNQEAIQTKIVSVKSIPFMAEGFLNSPYLWGGKTPMGFDCSGFTQVLFRMAGIMLPRDASLQYQLGTPVDSLKEIQYGDLAFFGSEQLITHVGIVSGKHEIIHCSAKVRKDSFDTKGIFVKESGIYSHFLKGIKRINT